MDRDPILRPGLPIVRPRYDVVRYDGRRRHGAEILLALGASAAFLGSTAGAVAIAAVNIAISLAASLALSFVSKALFGRGAPSQPDIKRELAKPESLPPYRFAYGHGPAYGSPWPIRHPDADDSAAPDDELVGCLVFNSRPSEGNFTVEVDDREVTYTGDPYDFTGDGAEVTGPGKLADHLRFWIGLGDQTAPPEWMTTNYGNTFTTGDKYRNLTVLWFHLDRGSSTDLAERWPNWPPVFRMVGDWSLLYDLRDPDHDIDDPTTWTFSENRALAVLDALTQNPFRPYPLAAIHTASVDAAAAVDDEDVPRKAGGTEKRHRVSGVIIWDERELHQQIEPLVLAGGAVTDLVRIGGKLGLVPGDLPESAMTITEVLREDGVDWVTLVPGRDLASRVTCSYVEPSHGWEAAELPVYEVPGAVAEDGGVPATEHLSLDFVPSHAQAARLQKRHAYRLREQRRFTGTLPPRAFDLVSGSGVTLNLAAPYARMNRLYQVRAIRPQLDMERSDGGVVLRCPVELVEVHADAYDWDAATEEPDVPEGPAVTTTPGTLSAPTNLAVTSETRPSGVVGVTGAQLKWDPVTAEITRYGTQYRVTDAGGGTPGPWQAGPLVDPDIRDAGGDVFVFIGPLQVGETYDFRVRALNAGRTSAWATITSQTILGDANALSAPTANSATATGSSSITVSFTLPNEVGVYGLAIYRGDTSDTGAMAQIATIYREANVTINYADTGLSAATTYYYAGKTLDQFLQQSASFSGVVNATTDP